MCCSLPTAVVLLVLAAVGVVRGEEEEKTSALQPEQARGEREIVSERMSLV